jgi:RNA polymerase sigma factor (sigma-70 family)
VAEETCWTVIRAAAGGDAKARTEFARQYLAVVRAALSARWRGSKLQKELDDAIQDVFVECFRAGGAIERADPSRRAGFKSYLLGVVQNVAARIEKRHVRSMRKHPADAPDPEEFTADETSLSKAFDREWARTMMRRAGSLQKRRARERGAAAERRVVILKLRFEEDLPVRAIAERLGMERASAHHEYARARDEFKEALREVVSFHYPGSPKEVDRECMQLLGLLQ